MLNLNLSTDMSRPLYLQLYTQIRDQIRSGTLAYESRLPSVRSLQLQFNMSKTPIETAYQMLVTEGYAISKPRSGLYVRRGFEHERGLAQDPDPGSSPVMPGDKPAHGSIPPNPAASLRPRDNYLVDFRVSLTDEPSFPVRTWKKMLQTAWDTSFGRISKYGNPMGEYSFRTVLAAYLRNFRGVVCRPEQIVIGTGIAYSMGLLAKLFPRDLPIAFEDPGYAPVQEPFRHAGFETLPIPVHAAGLSLEHLYGSEAQAVYVTPSHQYPTGCVMPYAEREQLLHWAASRSAYIIEDDYDSEFRYHGKPIPSLQGLDRHARVIYIGTFSKAFTPALRMNYMVLPSGLLSQLKERKHVLYAPSSVDQLAMQYFIEQGHWFRHIRRVRSVYRRKHHKLIGLLNETFGPHITITGHSAGLHIQMTVKTTYTSQDLVKMAANERIRVYDSLEMQSGDPAPGFPQIYIGFGGLSETEIELGIRHLHKAWGPCWSIQ
ncbi:PLP-dependent aminotransferase family protein [Paenibacillus sp. GCM10023248]|uniref:MocR-like pyridoxine biosynthesis transcription factor PdxR n=1 Tax=Bacillales TaxID=1385 RepID=UPI0023794AE6|nr:MULTISPECIES: PLP-dependent aminotransferase family protein [Bacillales]MDD9269022.1 PLP-dependent aminotransferase family protein [Paenibacillus sp. MAHUQ-63]MDR6884979.1 GntR family transcriptional regulator/MocR family aminotransferase [Bacillus sp. 3255]